MKYRKKPVVVEAFKYGYENTPEWFRNTEIVELGVRYCSIKTLEGVMTAHVGDYIIKGIKGEIYPCKSDIFEATYEGVMSDE